MGEAARRAARGGTAAGDGASPPGLTVTVFGPDGSDASHTFPRADLRRTLTLGEIGVGTARSISPDPLAREPHGDWYVAHAEAVCGLLLAGSPGFDPLQAWIVLLGTVAAFAPSYAAGILDLTGKSPSAHLAVFAERFPREFRCSLSPAPIDRGHAARVGGEPGAGFPRTWTTRSATH